MTTKQQEPYTVAASAIATYIYGPSGRLIAQLFYNGLTDDEAEAQRIAACLNACEGIADPSAVPDLLEALKSTLLLAEIKWGNLDSGAVAVFDKARAAIRKATGTNQ